MPNLAAATATPGGAELQLVHGDMLAALPAMPACTFHACVTDPPYHLTTGRACLAEGRDAVLVERETDYVTDIRNALAADRRRMVRAA